jgi:hypothetical protein
MLFVLPCLMTTHMLHFYMPACLQGGGIYSKGLQQDSLGAFGALIINHTMITNNTASFGGGIACDSCRAILAAQIDGNQAIRNVSLDNTTSNNWGAAPGGWGGSSGSSSGCGNGTGSGSSSSSSAANSMNPRRLRHAVLGAGGGVAANLAGNSYVVICVSGNGTSIDDRGKSSLRNNTAQALGGAVYLNSTMIAPDCPFPQPGRELTETCFPGGYWPKKCGFNTLDLDWQGSRASAGGDLVAWAGDTAGFKMACTLSGPECAFNGSALLDANVSGSSGSGSSSGEGKAAGPMAAISTADGSKPKGSKHCHGWHCKKSLPGDGSGNSSQQKACVRTFDAQSPYVCAAGSGINRPALGSNSSNRSSSRGVLLVDESRKFQLPASFYVYVSTREVVGGSQQHACAKGQLNFALASGRGGMRQLTQWFRLRTASSDQLHTILQTYQAMLHTHPWTTCQHMPSTTHTTANITLCPSQTSPLPLLPCRTPPAYRSATSSHTFLQTCHIMLHIYRCTS